jgi:hypothetical protein
VRDGEEEEVSRRRRRPSFLNEKKTHGSRFADFPSEAKLASVWSGTDEGLSFAIFLRRREHVCMFFPACAPCLPESSFPEESEHLPHSPLF